MPGDVLCLSHLRWGFVYQRPNHLMSRWARERRVFFVEEPVWGASEPRMEVTIVEPNLHVCVPHLVDGTPGDQIEGLQARLLDELVSRERIKDPLLWFYTPMAMGFGDHIRSSITVYDCMDELSHFAGAPAALKDREARLFERADLVFTGGQSLYEAKRGQHPHVHAFPSSVDAAHFGKARAGMEDPADQRAIAHPRFGFFGVVDERLDVELLREAATLRPDYQFVIIGPVVKIDPASLPKLPNIHYLGGKKYDELPAYLANWDVAIMPFARNDATKFISPTKTLEYLAAGKPVVSTSIRDVVRPYGERRLARIADAPEDFCRACDETLAERGTPAEKTFEAAREAYLAQTSWDMTFGRMRALVEEVAHKRDRHSEATEAKEAVPCSTI